MLFDAILKECVGWLTDIGYLRKGQSLPREKTIIRAVDSMFDGGFAAFIAADQSLNVADVRIAMFKRYGPEFQGYYLPQTS